MAMEAQRYAKSFLLRDPFPIFFVALRVTFVKLRVTTHQIRIIWFNFIRLIVFQKDEIIL
jgi:hypothetical protein